MMATRNYSAKNVVVLLILAYFPTAFAQTGSIEVGAGYNSEDSYKLGQYTGHQTSGGFGVGSFSLQSSTTNANNRYWNISGKNLGLESGSVQATYGQWGSFSLNFSFDQIPHYRLDDARTVFDGSSSTRQTLPANWVGASSTSGLTVLTSNLNELKIDKKRERFATGLKWQINQSWQLMSEYRHETKKGNETLGAIFGTSGGNPRGAKIARPIDFQTDDITIGLIYSNQTTQYNLSYNAILFSNKDKALRFDNPFNNSQWASGANFSDGAVGQIALEPDNTSSQFSFSAAHTLGSGTRVSGSLVSTRLEQDDSYLPFSSVFPATTPLPRQDLNARVDSLVANLHFSTRLNRRSTLRLSYRYRDRDNKTPQDIYLRIPGDAATQGSLLSERARINRLYDIESRRFNVDTNYRFGGMTKLSAGYQYQEKDRSMVDVATTKEDTGFVKLNFAPFSIASGYLKLSRSRRDASTYDSTVPFVAGHNPDYVATLVGDELFENDPLLRRFHLTDRDRDELRASLNIYPSDAFGISLLVMLAEDEYPDAKIGLQESEKRNFAVDLSYSPDTNWMANIYYNYDNYVNLQQGFARRGGGNPTPFFPESVRNPSQNWTINSEDNVYTFGAVVEWELMDGRLDLSLDASYIDAETETDPFSTGQAFLPFPDVTTKITTLSFKSNYRLQPGRELAIGYFYERYKSNDWALDGAFPDSLSNIMLLGNQSPEYSGHILQLSVIFQLE